PHGAAAQGDNGKGAMTRPFHETEPPPIPGRFSVTLIRELAPAFKPYRQVDGVADFIDRLQVA
ncbi:hypothetical protein ABT126_44930, partial [Streptomyces sp. NPDC002012]|uniref:hypothetical protein n=1 Tax=Streptomyces sp. NPDC002012 TaxID=3154532 RepID=UPI003317BD43